MPDLVELCYPPHHTPVELLEHFAHRALLRHQQRAQPVGHGLPQLQRQPILHREVGHGPNPAVAIVGPHEGLTLLQAFAEVLQCSLEPLETWGSARNSYLLLHLNHGGVFWKGVENTKSSALILQGIQHLIRASLVPTYMRQ